MPDDVPVPVFSRPPVAGRPLAGMTFLLVEDSRFACEAIRLLGLRAGARLRRADSLRAARRHLQTYRPSVVICDLGLPDGSGIEFISDIANSPFRPPALLGLSGDPDAAAAAIAAGADGFLVKPIESFAVFQSAILAALSGEVSGTPDETPEDCGAAPDILALRDDLSRAAEVLRTPAATGDIDYVAGFLRGVARIAKDAPLEKAAVELAAAQSGGDRGGQIRTLSGLVEARLATGSAF